MSTALFFVSTNSYLFSDSQEGIAESEKQMLIFYVKVHRFLDSCVEIQPFGCTYVLQLLEGTVKSPKIWSMLFYLCRTYCTNTNDLLFKVL